MKNKYSLNSSELEQKEILDKMEIDVSKLNLDEIKKGKAYGGDHMIASLLSYENRDNPANPSILEQEHKITQENKKQVIGEIEKEKQNNNDVKIVQNRNLLDRIRNFASRNKRYNLFKNN
jgi:hypothetical protein